MFLCPKLIVVFMFLMPTGPVRSIISMITDKILLQVSGMPESTKHLVPNSGQSWDNGLESMQKTVICGFYHLAPQALLSLRNAKSLSVTRFPVQHSCAFEKSVTMLILECLLFSMKDTPFPHLKNYNPRYKRAKEERKDSLSKHSNFQVIYLLRVFVLYI